MKNLKRFPIRMTAFAVVLLSLFQPVRAQLSMSSFANVDWQFSAPVGNDFADKGNGWGMNFEAGCYVTPNVAVGGFINYMTNNQYFSRRTLVINSTSAMNTDQVHQLFQLPFGVLGSYRFAYNGAFRPYVALKMGAEYAQLESSFNIYTLTKNTWGFYVSPELGMQIFPWKNGVGLHVAVFYGYATNRTDALPGYNMKGINNLGFRVGLAF